MRILITGGAGFIGSNFCYYLKKKRPALQQVVLDKLTYCGNLDNLKDLRGARGFRFIRGDIADRKSVVQAMRGVEMVMHFAAESFVDRSLHQPVDFVRSNVQGTQVLLDEARRVGVKKFVQVSTDEVYGSLGARGKFTENSPLQPSSPYSASKAASDLLALSYYRSYGLPVVVTRCSNNYGPYQFPEKLIPLMISNALEGRDLPVYGKGLNVRDWIYVQDHCSALEAVLRKGKPGEVYNIGGDAEEKNIDVVRSIIKILDVSPQLIKYLPDSIRPGHDFRYAISHAKLTRQTGWQPSVSFREGIEKTVVWYLDNQPWWQKIKKRAAFKAFYKKHYKTR